MGDFGKAETLLTGRLQADRDNIAAGSALAPLYLIAGRPDDAKKIYDAVLSRKPDDVAALIGLAYIAVAEQQWPQAMDYSKRARRAAPDDPIPGLRLVNLYTFRRDWKNATATAAELAEQFPTNGDVMELQARAQIGAGDIDGAISTYERAHEIAPDSLPILSGYVDLLRSAKKDPEAWTLLQAALDRDPWTPITRADLLFGPTSPNSAISPFPAPYAPVDANLTTFATATATSTSVDSGTDSLLMGGGGSVDVNVNAASFTIGSISRTPLSATFDPPLLRYSGAKNVDGFRTLNLTIDDSDDFKNAMNSISFVISNTGGTWTTPNDVLTPNGTPK